MVSNLKILFLTDGSLKIGMGHIYRSLNLANELQKNNKIIFVTREKLSAKIFKKKYKTFFVNKNDITKEKNIISKFDPDLIIIDKLKERNSTISNIRSICNNLLFIDYTKKNIENTFYGITMLYPITGFSSEKYLTLKYSILNKKFSENRVSKIKPIVKKIIILQGGSDTYCFTPKIIDSFNSIPEKFDIAVVVGKSFKCWEKLEKSIKNSKQKISLLNDVPSLAPILKNYDLAITAGGMTLLELACVGVPSLVVCGEKFEIETANLLQKNNFGINLGFGKNLSKKKISRNIEFLKNNYTLRKKMNTHGQKLIDGKGVIRVKEFIYSHNFHKNSKF